jgi:hypothetical protein
MPRVSDERCSVFVVTSQTSSAPEPITFLVDGESVQPIGHRHALVESKSEPGTWHAVDFDEERQRWTCVCKGWSVRKTCRHAVAIARLDAGEAEVRFTLDGERYRVQPKEGA